MNQGPNLEAHALEPHLQAWHHLAISGRGAKRRRLLETWPESFRNLQETPKTCEKTRFSVRLCLFSTLNRAVGGSERLLTHMHVPRDAYRAQSDMLDSHATGFYPFLCSVSHTYSLCSIHIHCHDLLNVNVAHVSIKTHVQSTKPCLLVPQVH